MPGVIFAVELALEAEFLGNGNEPYSTGSLKPGLWLRFFRQAIFPPDSLVVLWTWKVLPGDHRSLSGANSRSVT